MSSVDEIGPKIYRFGPFEIDLDQRLLLRAGESIPLTPKAFDTLAVLAASPGRVLEKGDLLKLVWPDTFVEENNLTQNISVLRKAFGEGEYIETIPRRGYRFLARVEKVSLPKTVDLDAAPSPIVAPPHGLRSRWIWTVAAIAVVALLAIFASLRFRVSRSPDYRVDSLIVLPFVNLSSDPDIEYFSDGLTEELTNALAQLNDVKVVSRTTAFQFKGKTQDIRSFAQQLHVGTVIEGSVRRQGKRFRVTVQLNDALSGYHRWSQTYDRDEGDIFSIQEDISNQVARTIRPDSKPARASHGTRNPEAYNSYLLGRFYRNRPDRAARKRAVGFFQAAIERDPRYAAAYAGLAECYTLLAFERGAISPLDALAEAQKAVDKALALDEDLAEAHTSQGFVYLQLARNWPAAEQQFRRAITLNRNDSAAHHWFSHYLVAMGRLSESLAESRRALELDPLDVHTSSHLIWNYLRARDYPNAVKAGLQTLELDPHNELAYQFLAWTYEDAGQWENAIDAWQHANAVHPQQSILQAAFQTGGSSGYWRARLAFLSIQKSPNDYQVAVLHSRLGESAKALDRLERAFQAHEPELIYVKREPAFDPIAGELRFRALIEVMHLP